jgi:hypothetical protein
MRHETDHSAVRCIGDVGSKLLFWNYRYTTASVARSTAATSTTTAVSGEEALVLVAFGDSIISYASANAAAIGAYADMLEEEFGAPVDVRNRAVFGSSPVDLIKALGSERLQKDLAEADVVLLEIPQGDTNPAFPTATGWHGMDPADCGGDDNQQCLRDTSSETGPVSRRSSPHLRQFVIRLRR